LDQLTEGFLGCRGLVLIVVGLAAEDFGPQLFGNILIAIYAVISGARPGLIDLTQDAAGGFIGDVLTQESFRLPGIDGNFRGTSGTGRIRFGILSRKKHNTFAVGAGLKDIKGGIGNQRAGLGKIQGNIEQGAQTTPEMGLADTILTHSRCA